MRQLLRVFPVAVAIALIVPAMTPTVAQAQTVDGQRQKVEDIVDELERLEEQSNQIAEEYVEAIDTKTALDAEIVEAEARVAAKEAELAELRGNLGEMALRSFVGGGAAPLGPLFEDSTNLNDVLQRDELARVALSAGDVTSDELDALVSDLEQERADLAAKREEADQLAESLVAAQERTEELTSDYEAARTEAENTLGDLIAEEEARRAAESLRQMQAAAQAASQSNAGTRWRRRRWWRRRWRWRHDHRWHHDRVGRRRDRTRGEHRPGPRRLVTLRDRDLRGDGPAGRSVPLRRIEPGRGVRLFRSHRVRMGPGRRRAPAPVACAVRIGAARVASRGPAWRPAVLLQPDQPRRHLPGWRPVGPRAEHRFLGEGRCGQLEQGHRRRPTRLTRSPAGLIGPTAGTPGSTNGYGPRRAVNDQRHRP